MSKRIQHQIKFFTGIGLLFAFSLSCQRQLHFDETPAEGFLKKDAPGNCVSIVVAGTYKIDKQLGDTNFLEVEVEVSRKGNYTITTDTINGFWFVATGKFDNTGSFKVKLRGLGKPSQAGSNNFTVRFNSSVCQASVTVLDNAIASFSLLGAPNQCRNAVPEGVYTRNVALTNANRIKVEAYATSPGFYSITTNTVNGYQFSGSGHMPSAGNHILVLTAIGTPVAEGTNLFTVSAGASDCTFSITVVGGGSSGTPNHFPLTANSTWTYDNDYFGGGVDSVKRKIADSVFVNGHFYKIIEQKNRWDTSNYQCRRSGNDYFEYGPADRYTEAVHFNPQLTADMPFLKENPYNGELWYSPTYTGTVVGGTMSLRYVYVCNLNDATAVINGTSFNQIIRIIMRVQVLYTGAFSYTGEAYELLYANGVGLVQMTKTMNGYPQNLWEIRSWNVY